MNELAGRSLFSPDDWVENYWRTSDDPEGNQARVDAFLKKFYKQLFGKKVNCRVLLPLCGKSGDLIWLADKGHSVVGIEYCKYAIESFFEYNKLPFHKSPLQNSPFDIYQSLGKDVTIYRGDFFDMNTKICGQFDAIWDRGSFVAINTDKRIQYTDIISRLMGPDCNCLLSAVMYDPPEFPGPPHYVTLQNMRETFGRHCRFEVIECIRHKRLEMGRRIDWTDTIYLVQPHQSKSPLLNIVGVNDVNRSKHQ